MKTLNQDCPNVHIFVSQFWSCCSPNRNPMLENQLTGFSLFLCLLQHIKIATNMVQFFIFFPRLTKTEVLICRYIDVDCQRYSYGELCIEFTKEGPCWDVPFYIQCIFLPLPHSLRCLVFSYLTAKKYFRLLEFPSDTLVHWI